MVKGRDFMSAHFFCEAFTEIEGKVAVNDGLVYLILSSPDGNSDLHITINPLQAKIRFPAWRAV